MIEFTEEQYYVLLTIASKEIILGATQMAETGTLRNPRQLCHLRDITDKLLVLTEICNIIRNKLLKEYEE